MFRALQFPAWNYLGIFVMKDIIGFHEDTSVWIVNKLTRIPFSKALDWQHGLRTEIMKNC